MKNHFRLIFTGVLFSIVALLLCSCGEVWNLFKDGKNKTTPKTASLSVNIVNTCSMRVNSEGYHEGITPQSGVSVVLGDSTGALITSGTTDKDGTVTFSDPPAGAMVTAAYIQHLTDYKLDTIAEVNTDEITFGICTGDHQPWRGTEVGVITVNVANVPDSVAHWHVQPLWEYEEVSETTKAFTVYEDNIQSDGRLTLLAVGHDANDEPVSYGVAEDITLETTPDVTVDMSGTDFSVVPVTVTDIPENATALQAGVGFGRKGVNYGSPDRMEIDFTTQAGPTIIETVMYVPGLGDSYWTMMSIELDADGDGEADARHGKVDHAELTGEVTIDLSPQMPVTVNSIPQTATKMHLAVELRGMQDGEYTSLYSARFDIDSPGTQAVLETLGAVPGDYDYNALMASVEYDTNGNGTVDAHKSVRIVNDTLSGEGIVYDFNESPAIPPGDISITGFGTARPTISWTGGNAGYDKLRFSIYGSKYNAGYGLFVRMPSESSGITVPELPDSLASFRPDNWTLGSGGIGYWEVDFISGYDDHLETENRVYAGTFAEPGFHAFMDSERILDISGSGDVTVSKLGINRKTGISAFP